MSIQISETVIKALAKAIGIVVEVMEKCRFGSCMFVILAVGVTALRNVQIVISWAA
jgi:hypothetical protein